jgi:hypothetical protein
LIVGDVPELYYVENSGLLQSTGFDAQSLLALIVRRLNVVAVVVLQSLLSTLFIAWTVDA